ncbi:MAG TPA: hypothetical protein VMK32_01170 [Burkholderiaceae bacterium]|nr:hypothetical protein [Burkholderiaceae bacterium]
MLAAVGALALALATAPASAECTDDVGNTASVADFSDAFALAPDADLAYLPFVLGESQDENAQPLAEDHPADETVILAGGFDFD